jgi:hypothetical protein
LTRLNNKIENEIDEGMRIEVDIKGVLAYKLPTTMPARVKAETDSGTVLAKVIGIAGVNIANKVGRASTNGVAEKGSKSGDISALGEDQGERRARMGAPKIDAPFWGVAQIFWDAFELLVMDLRKSGRKFGKGDEGKAGVRAASDVSI